MMIGDRFPGDTAYMQDLQHDMYHDAVVEILSKAQAIYRHAMRVLNIPSPLGAEAIERTNYDHRTLQLLHDRIAARFRYLNKVRLNQHMMRESLPGMLSEMGEDVYYQTLWREYHSKMLDDLYEQQPELVHYVLTACTYPNPDKRGMDAEDEMDKMTNWLQDFHQPFIRDWEYAFSEIKEDG